MLSLELEGIGKWFGERKVFENLNLKLENPTCLAVIGPNGSGKTTLLRIICGLIRPSQGKVSLKLDNQVVKKEAQGPFFSLVAPDLQLYDELTAFENLKFFSQLRDAVYSKDNLMQKIEQVGLKKREDDLVSSYSAGMKQRLKYALALLSSSKILLLDEPSSNLDEEGILVMEQIIQQHQEVGIVILATNDLKETQYAQQIFKLGN
ncbi:MAG: heme ABC exporter, ATP-binding protein CcmA [candidate division Zixibacteria bacterium RBG_16_40_9]|nr:MAG: heme ABC exporter, ATP-binding protein CcmA [candidate division Zixibacteria bacterium RBG_16_40_9]